jgi:hypothetical protein
MSFDDYKLVSYRNQPDVWVAEIPAIPGCHARMPAAEEVVSELAKVFLPIEAEQRASGHTLCREYGSLRMGREKEPKQPRSSTGSVFR